MSSKTIEELRELTRWIKIYIQLGETMVVEMLRQNRQTILKRGW